MVTFCQDVLKLVKQPKNINQQTNYNNEKDSHDCRSDDDAGH